MIHMFGWGERPVNRYKAYDCFCQAHSAGWAAASHNRAVCKWMGHGCKMDEDYAVAELKAMAVSATSSVMLKAIALVGGVRLLRAALSPWD